MEFKALLKDFRKFKRAKQVKKNRLQNCFI